MRVIEARPVRDSINLDSLVLLGIPKRFCDKSLKDFQTFGVKSLKNIKSFVSGYIKNINGNFKDGRGICFLGSNGVGKSFLSCLILKEAYRNRYSCRRVTFSNYISAYTESWNAPKEEKEDIERNLMETYKGTEFLVLEEIGKEIDSKIAKPILEDLLRYREEKGFITIICTNLSPENLKSFYGASVVSLINGNCTVIVIEETDKRPDVFEGVL